MVDEQELRDFVRQLGESALQMYDAGVVFGLKAAATLLEASPGPITKPFRDAINAMITTPPEQTTIPEEDIDRLVVQLKKFFA